MDKNKLIELFGWGLVLWLVGYVLGIMLFTMVPASLIGWIITPIGTALTLWVLFKKVTGGPIQYYLLLATIWTLIAVVFDYLFLVKAFKPEDGYYKPDVYVYYALTCILPVAVGLIKKDRKNARINEH